MNPIEKSEMIDNICAFYRHSGAVNGDFLVDIFEELPHSVHEMLVESPSVAFVGQMFTGIGSNWTMVAICILLRSFWAYKFSGLAAALKSLNKDLSENEIDPADFCSALKVIMFFR